MDSHLPRFPPFDRLSLAPGRAGGGRTCRRRRHAATPAGYNPTGGARGAERSDVYGAPGVRSPFSYGLRGTPVGARVGAQPSQHAPVVPDRIVALGRLDNLNHSREACVAHDPSERLGPDLPFADPLVAVAAR